MNDKAKEAKKDYLLMMLEEIAGGIGCKLVCGDIWISPIDYEFTVIPKLTVRFL